MTKKNFKNSLLLFLFGIITLSCSLENEAVHQHEHSKKASYQRKMYDELILDKNFSKAIKQIPKKNVSASSSLNRTVMEEQYGFTIFDVPINVMETDSIISYNLCIQTDSLAKGDFFENLVINSNKFTNTIDAYLVKYNLLSEITPSAHGSFSFDFEPEIKPINYDASTARAFTWCYSYHYEMCHELVPGTQFESPHTPTEACNQQSLIYTHTETRCIVIGESGGTGDSGAFESSSSGTSGQSSDPYNNGQSSYGNNTIIINPNPLTGPTPSELKRIREQCFLNTFLSTAQSNWLKSPANAQTRNAIYDYLATQTNYGSGDDLACYPNDAMEFAEEAINKFINGEDCVILPTVFNPLDIEADFDSNLFGDYPAPLIDPDHDAIEQQFINLRNTTGNLAAVNYLISTYNMNTFNTMAVTFSYSISFGDGLPTEDHANAIIGYNTYGTMVSCELQIDTNLFSIADFGYITRVIKHELYHILQAQVYGQFNVSNAAREFDAYYSQLFGFRDLKRINDLGIEEGIAEKLWQYANQMTASEKIEAEKKINKVKQYFPEICKN